MRRGRILFGLGVAVTVVGTVAAVPAFASGGGGPVAQPILGSGSDTTQFMMASIDDLYRFSPGCAQIPTPSGPTPWLDFSCQSPDPAGTITTENYEHDQPTEAYFLGSSNGINQLCDQGQTGVARIDFARSSRDIKVNSQGVVQDCSGLNFVAYARDGIPMEIFPNASGSPALNMSNHSGTCNQSGLNGNTPYCFTQAQLQGIFVTCTITDWSQLGGQPGPIDMYTAQPGSGTRSQFDTFLGGSSDTCIKAQGTTYANTHIIPENENQSILANGDQANAIFPFSFGIWTTTVKTSNSVGAVLSSIDNIAASVSTIRNLSFPYGRYLFNVYCRACSWGSSSQATVNYVGPEGWICKPQNAVNGSSTLTGHTTDPTTGVNYFTEIQKAITSRGFVTLSNGTIGGGDTNKDYCRLHTT